MMHTDTIYFVFVGQPAVLGCTFFLEAFCDISLRHGGINPFSVFSDAFPGLKMWDTFACATAKFFTHFIISIAVCVCKRVYFSEKMLSDTEKKFWSVIANSDPVD
jgi:hypothetical protein